LNGERLHLVQRIIILDEMKLPIALFFKTLYIFRYECLVNQNPCLNETKEKK